MTILVKNNIYPLMLQSVQYFLLSHFHQLKLVDLRARHDFTRPCEKYDVLKSKPQTDIVWP
jgi:hypothetical protein